MTDRGKREGRVRTGSATCREPDKTYSTAAAVWAAGIAMFVAVATAAGPLAAMSIEDAPPPANGPRPATQIVGMSPGGGGGGLTYGGVQSSSLGSFTININAGAGLLANAPAMAAFVRGAAQWEAWISDPITVNIDANLADMGSTTIIGSTSTVILFGDYAEIRDPMVADAANESDDGIVAFLPTEAQFSASVPAGMAVSGLSAAKANLKALGFTGLDANFGTTDATITFNTQFAFDYDNSNGVSGGTVDFETVAAHELGHALGFISEVDYADQLVNLGLVGTLIPRTLDLFRFENDDSNDPATTGQFTSMPRSLVPNVDAITDEITPIGFDGAEERMSTGASTGDGRQASHWKDNFFTGDLVGVMDPTLPYATVMPLDLPDLRALDLIGYEIVTPEPATLCAVGLGSLLILRRRRRT